MAPISKSHLTRLLNKYDAATTNTDKGKFFTDTAEYVFKKISGLTLSARDAIDDPGEHELDLAFWNDQTKLGLPFLPHILLLECKGTQDAVGTAQINHFATKVQARALSHGILIAANGVTGSANGRRNANAALRHHLAQRVSIVVITRAELEILTDSSELIALLKQKLTNLAVGRAV